MGLAITTILVAYISALSNQAVAQTGQIPSNYVPSGEDEYNTVLTEVGHPGLLGGIYSGHHGVSSVGHSGLLGGIGFGVAAITKFKAHKDNPTQITSGIGLGVGVLHKFTP